MPTIYVSRNGNSYNLKLRDSEGNNPGNDNLDTWVNPGDLVTWELDNNSGLDAIIGILPLDKHDKSYDSNSVDLFVSICCSKGSGNLGNIFKGQVVSTSLWAGKYEKYKIGFMVPNDGTIYWDDPKIEMNT
jgi:hypothetical protein